MRALWAVVGLALAAGAGWTWWAVQPCWPFDRSGCLARIGLSDLAGLGDTIAVGPDGQTLWVAGVSYGPQRDRLVARPIIVELDVQAGTETARLKPNFEGVPAQLAVSANGEQIAIANSAIYARSTSLVVVDGAGDIVSDDDLDPYAIVPDAEGYFFQTSLLQSDILNGLAFQADRQEEPTLRRVESHLTGVELPEGFVPMTRATVAVSPDRRRRAVLVRRFSGPGRIRAILQIEDAVSSAVVARHEITTDLYAALAWDPLGRGVIVATAQPIAAGAGTELRIYRADGWS